MDESDPRAIAYRKRQQQPAASSPSPSMGSSTFFEGMGAGSGSRTGQASASGGQMGGRGVSRGQGGEDAAGAIAEVHDPFTRFFPPGSALSNINTQLCAVVPPFRLGNINVQPGLLAIATIVAFFFGVRGLAGLALVIFLFLKS